MIGGVRKSLLDRIKRKGELTLGEACRHTGLSKSSVREHLLQLEEEGFIRREFIRSGPGRPALRYRLTGKGHARYPSSESALLREFAAWLRDQGEEEKLERFFRIYWQERYERAVRLMRDRPDKPLEALLSMLRDEGFMPETEEAEGEQTRLIRECNCPFRELVRETRIPCRLELEFYRKLFGKGVKRVSHIVEDDHSCSYRIGGS